jgi:hypothetical protein
MTTHQTTFGYVVLRYMHDVFTREFVNVGVLLCAPQANFLGFKRLRDLDRVKAVFPGADSDSLGELLTFFESRAQEFNKSPQKDDAPSVETIAKALLPADDSALQWSPPGGGVTGDPHNTLNEVFERLVTRHSKVQPMPEVGPTRS